MVLFNSLIFVGLCYFKILFLYIISSFFLLVYFAVGSISYIFHLTEHFICIISVWFILMRSISLVTFSLILFIDFIFNIPVCIASFFFTISIVILNPLSVFHRLPCVQDLSQKGYFIAVLMSPHLEYSSPHHGAGVSEKSSWLIVNGKSYLACCFGFGSL